MFFVCSIAVYCLLPTTVVSNTIGTFYNLMFKKTKRIKTWLLAGCFIPGENIKCINRYRKLFPFKYKYIHIYLFDNSDNYYDVGKFKFKYVYICDVATKILFIEFLIFLIQTKYILSFLVTINLFRLYYRTYNCLN